MTRERARDLGRVFGLGRSYLNFWSVIFEFFPALCHRMEITTISTVENQHEVEKFARSRALAPCCCVLLAQAVRAGRSRIRRARVIVLADVPSTPVAVDTRLIAQVALARPPLAPAAPRPHRVRLLDKR